MDFLALYITARLMHTVIRPLRISLAAAIGALYALAAVLLDAFVTNVPAQLLSFILGILCMYVMAVISFSRTPREALKAGTAYAAVNIGLGGTMTAICSMLTKLSLRAGVAPTSVSPEASPVTFIIVAFISGAVSLIYGKIRARSMAKKKIDVVLTILGTDVKLTLLCDSGNLLREPIGGKPVLIIGASKIKDKLPRELLQAAVKPLSYTELPHELTCKVRLIPANGVMGNGILLGFIPDKVTMDGYELDAVVAIDAVNDSFGECDGIMPQILLGA